MAAGRFEARQTIEQVEEGNDLAPKFDDRGLITVVTTDATSGELLMQGYMNAEALSLTIETGEAHYWSRSRQVLWHKGATSGLVQTVKELLVDDDQDCIWLRVDVAGGASCHVGYRSCFYRRVPVGEEFAATVSGLPPGTWSGPHYSPFGAHLVRVDKRNEARMPALAEVRDLVLREYRAQQSKLQKDVAYQKLRETYEITVDSLEGMEGADASVVSEATVETAQ